MIAKVADKVVVPEALFAYVVIASAFCIASASLRQWYVFILTSILTYAYGVMNFYIIDKDIIDAVEQELGSLNYRYWNLVYLAIPMGVGILFRALQQNLWVNFNSTSQTK